LLALLVATVVTMLYAAPGKTNKQPVLSPVTVNIEGFQCAGCATSLQGYLAKQKGVSEVNATMKPAQVTAMLDEKVMPVSKFVAVIDKQKNLHDKLFSASFVTYIDAAMCKGQAKMCEGCPTEIKKMLKDVKGITGITFDETGRVATIGLDPKVSVTTTQIAAALKKSKFNFIVSFTDPKPADKDSKEQATGSCPMGGDKQASEGGCNMDSNGGGCDMGGGDSGGGCPMTAGK